MKRLFPIARVCSWLIATHSFAGSATWDLNPTSGDWNTAANWTPATVPNSQTDVATFSHSNVLDVATSADIALDSLDFDAQADSYIFTFHTDTTFDFWGAGIINN